MIYETIHSTTHYRQISYIEMGIEPDDQFEKRARDEAAAKNWTFQKIQGDLRLFQGLINGNWDENDFLIVHPGQQIVVSLASDQILVAEP